MQSIIGSPTHEKEYGQLKQRGPDKRVPEGRLGNHIEPYFLRDQKQFWCFGMELRYLESLMWLCDFNLQGNSRHKVTKRLLLRHTCTKNL